jgi:DNA-binding Lrp family transcriptional regulator
MPQGITVLLNVFVESEELESVTRALEKLPQVTDLYEVTGEYDLVALLKTDSISGFRELLKNRILRIKGIRSTVSAVIIHMHKKEGKPVAD